MLDTIVDILNSPEILKAINKEVGKKIVPYDKDHPETQKKCIIFITKFESTGDAIAVEAVIA